MERQTSALELPEEDHSKVLEFYTHFHDNIRTKRHESPYWIRNYSHHAILAGFVRRVPAGAKVLDAGCGDGMLSVMLAKKGAHVTGLEISTANLDAAREYARQEGVSVEFVQGDVQSLPFENQSFDWVVSSHVLEHVPDLEKAAGEFKRVARGPVLVAMPTCWSLAAWAILGDGNYWKSSRKTLTAIPRGFWRTLRAWWKGTEGPDEGYVGFKDLPHTWRFPCQMRKRLENAGLRVRALEAGPLIIPYLPQYIRPLRKLQVMLDRYNQVGFLRFMGYGTLAICDTGSPA